MMLRLEEMYHGWLKKKTEFQLRQFKNCHEGLRCFVIGNGPSLTTEDLERLCNEFTFGCNKIYKLFPKTKWRPTYYVAQDDAVILEIMDDLHDIENECSKCFLNGALYRRYSKKIRRGDNSVFFLIRSENGGNVSVLEDITGGISNSSTVTFAMIQIAIYMGFKEIYLIGVDHNFPRVMDQEGHITIQNINEHFEGGDYNSIQDPGIEVWLLERAYQSAKDYAETHGIKIYNATRGGKLEVFERVDLDKIVGQR